MANQLSLLKKTELHKSHKLKPVSYACIQTAYFLQLSPRKTVATCPELKNCPVTIIQKKYAYS